MVAVEPEMISQSEIDSSDHLQNGKTHRLHTDRQGHAEGEPETNNVSNNHGHGGGYGFPNLGRQSSIYSLTLDEFQHTLCERGKNFGSMNMDEFLNSIWTAEENQAQGHRGDLQHHDQVNNSNLAQVSSAVNAAASSSSRGVIAKQPSLARQGSLTLPAPLCRKTVDEVWSEIQRTHQQEQQQQQSQNLQNQSQNQVGSSGSTQRQATFGEMTLEDFLIKAGVVREQCGPTVHHPIAVVPIPPAAAQHHPQFVFGNQHPQMRTSFVARPMMPGYKTMPVSGGDTSGFAGNAKRNNGYPAPAVAPSVACYSGRVNNGAPAAGGFGPVLSPVSPVSPDGMCGSEHVNNTSGQYGMELGVLRGRKRMGDGPVEKVVERRQRRMIKNRESAARSRARKQAYTVELEAELNQLREENAQLKLALTEIERQREQQYVEEQNMAALTKAERAQEKLRTMRSSRSCTV